MKRQYINPDEPVMGEEDETAKLKKWLFRMLRFWPWFLFSLLLCVSAAFLYLQLATPVYQAVASLMIKDETKEAELANDSKLKDVGLRSSSKLVVNELEVLKSYDLMEQVVDTLQLYVSVKQVGPLRDEPLFGDEIPFRVEISNPQSIIKTKHWTVTDTANAVLFKGENDKYPVLLQFGQIHNSDGIRFRFLPGTGHPGQRVYRKDRSDANYKVDVSSPDNTVLQYNKILSVEPASKLATVIDLEMRDNNNKRATAILQSLLDIYNQRGVDIKNRVTDNTIDFLNDRLATVSAELRTVEGTVEKFKSENRVTDLSSDAEQYLATSQQVDAQKAQSQTQLNIISALEQDLQVNQDNPQLVPSTLGIQDRSLSQLIEKHNELVLQKDRMQQISGPKNPLLIDQQNQIKEIRRKLLTIVHNLKQAYTISLNDISRKDAQLSSQIRNVPQLEKKLIQITRSQNVQEQLYAFLLQKREEAAVARASNIEGSQTIINARDLGVISPKKKIILAMSVLMGFIFPVAFFGLKDFINNKVGDTTEVEQRTDAPLLGVIAHVKKLRSSVVINPYSRSAVAEQIRNIRTSLNFIGKGKKLKTILITSFQSGDGKSFVSLNLAAGYALMHKKTVMLDFDLRKPHISRELGMDVQEGIGSILAGKSTIDDILVSVEGYEDYLYLLPAGHLTSNPAELISGEETSCLFKMLQERFDYIIINTPPISLVADATLLQPYADVSLIVLRQGHTSREVYKELRHRTTRHPEIPVYILLNDVGRKRAYQGRYGYGAYGYGLGKGYYHEDKR